MSYTKDNITFDRLPPTITIDGKVFCSPAHETMIAQGYVYTEPDIQTPTEEELRIAAIPFEITMRQARIVLLREGLLDEVESLVNLIGGEAKIVWEYSSMVQRNNPLVGMITSQAGWTVRQVDDMFTLAATL